MEEIEIVFVRCTSRESNGNEKSTFIPQFLMSL